MKILDFDEACNLILNLPKHTFKHSMEDSRLFLDRLGHPEEGMRVIHVAGTNGKGSICAYMESILNCAGFHTGCFISPHLVDMRERIRLDKEMCSKEDFAEAASIVYELAEELFYPSFFEFLFFVGMLVFKKRQIDVLILETGLGGRLDATNLLEHKDISIIASIGMDHMEYLGDTLDKIAYEKAGIMRADTPVVYWDDESASTLNACADECGASKYVLKKDILSGVNLGKDGIDFCLRYKYDIDICLTVRSKALYQVYNAAMAVSALNIWDVDYRISTEEYIEGVRSCFWPGRMEEIEPRIILDGAHNMPGVQEFLRSVSIDGADNRLLIIGCMRDKQYTDEIDLIIKSGLFGSVVAVGLEYGRALPAEELASSFAERGVQCRVACSVEDAIDIARAYAHSEDGNYVYIAGSLYLIGDVRGLIA